MESAKKKCDQVTDEHEYTCMHLNDGVYPETSDKPFKRRVRSKAVNYTYNNEDTCKKLYYEVKESKGQKLDSRKPRSHSQRMVLLTNEEKLEKMETLHSGTEGGHLGQMKTLHKIEQRYFWTNMTKDIREFV